jgi:hypothetical protein
MEYPDFTPRFLYENPDATPIIGPIGTGIPYHDDLKAIEPYSWDDNRGYWIYKYPLWESPYNCLTQDSNPKF